jgi:hypothetical protein
MLSTYDRTTENRVPSVLPPTASMTPPSVRLEAAMETLFDVHDFNGVLFVGSVFHHCSLPVLRSVPHSPVQELPVQELARDPQSSGGV